MSHSASRLNTVCGSSKRDFLTRMTVTLKETLLIYLRLNAEIIFLSSAELTNAYFKGQELLILSSVTYNGITVERDLFVTSNFVSVHLGMLVLC